MTVIMSPLRGRPFVAYATERINYMERNFDFLFSADLAITDQNVELARGTVTIEDLTT